MCKSQTSLKKEMESPLSVEIKDIIACSFNFSMSDGCIGRAAEFKVAHPCMEIPIRGLLHTKTCNILTEYTVYSTVYGMIIVLKFFSLSIANYSNHLFDSTFVFR